ncbi:MAG: hypothetical protein JWO58_2424 [Chitinophagaceae bacterium]|nr:hypothetical protein [Chitinophagaceae bacterium]
MSTDSIDAKESDYLYLSVSQIPKAGQGLFVAMPIYKDEVISIFKGERLTDREATRRAKNGEDAYFINCLDGTVLDSMHTHCFAKYANDPAASGGTLIKSKFKSNAEISMDDEENICLIAKRNIKMDEEIFCHYGKAYWENFHKLK